MRMMIKSKPGSSALAWQGSTSSEPMAAWMEQTPPATAHKAQPSTTKAAEGFAIAPAPKDSQEMMAPIEKETPIKTTGFTDPQRGTSGNDYLSLDDHQITYGYEGNDTFTYSVETNTQKRTVYGGEGYDTLVLENGNANMVVYFWSGRVFGVQNLFHVQFYDVESVKVMASSLSMYGDEKDNQLVSRAYTYANLWGGEGSDYIYGSDNGAADYLHGDDGNDHIFGRAGNDMMWGGAHNDELDGGSGNDYLNGERGNDILTGGSGRDIFDYDFVFSNGTTDTITDFDTADLGDRIDLSEWNYTDISELDIRTSYDETRIKLYNTDGTINTTIILKGVSEAQLGNGHFIF